MYRIPDTLFILCVYLWTDTSSLINKDSTFLENIYRCNCSLPVNLSAVCDSVCFITLSKPCSVLWLAWPLRGGFCSITIRINARCICAVHRYGWEQITLKYKGLFANDKVSNMWCIQFLKNSKFEIYISLLICLQVIPVFTAWRKFIW